MKKLIAVFILGVSLVVVPSVSAIEEMSDAVMKKTMGQAGVSVRVDNVVFEDVRFSMLYIDDDGITGTPEDAGGVRIKVAVGEMTFRAIFDYTDRGGYLKREYGTLMRRELANGGEPHWAGLSTGGDIPWKELTIATSKKLKLHSYMKAFNNRAAGLAEAKEAYEKLSSLSLIYSEANSTTNIDAVIAATGLAKGVAASVYSDANNYVRVLNDKTLADEVGTKVAFAKTSVSGVEVTLPTLEIFVKSMTRSYEVDADGAYNDGSEYIKIQQSDSVTAILGGRAEVCANR